MHPMIVKIAAKLWFPLILVLAGFVSGGWVVYKFYHVGEIGELKHTIEEQAAQHSRELALLQGHHANELAIERDRVTIKEVVKYVPDKRECDLDPAAVGVLERARKGMPPATPGASGNSGAASVYPRLPQRTEVQAHMDCGIRYRQLREQLTALIKWHKEVRE